MKKILLSATLVASFFLVQSDLQAQAHCPRGEIMTDWGCVSGRTQRGRKPPQAIDLKPKITHVTPSEVMMGESLVIHGENLVYGEKPQVLIEGELTNVLAASPAQLTITTHTQRKNPLITVISLKGRAEFRSNVRIWSGYCDNRQINQAFEELLKHRPTGEGNEGQCNPADYRGGQWSNYEQLKFAVRQRFGYVSKPAPEIDAIIPPSSQPDTWVEILGKNFDDLQIVIFGSNKASGVERISSNKIRAKVPFGAGSGITVSTLHGSDRWNGFDVLYPPQITNVEPLSATPGSRVTIRGNRLKDVTSPISFSGWNVGIDSKSDSEIVVTVPYKSPGKVKITLKTYDGQTVNWDNFEVVGKAQPRIVSLDPAPVLPDAWFTIRGENFNDFQRVAIGGSSVMSSEWVSPTEIRVQAPHYEYEGDVQVATKNGDTTARLVVKRPPQPPPPPSKEEPKVTVQPELNLPPEKLSEISKALQNKAGLTTLDPLTGNTPLTGSTGGVLTGNTPLIGTTGGALTANTGGALKVGDTLPGGNALSANTGSALNVGKRYSMQQLRGKELSSASNQQRVAEASPQSEASMINPILKEAVYRGLGLKEEEVGKYYPRLEQFLLDPNQKHYKKALEIYNADKNGYQLKQQILWSTTDFEKRYGITDFLWSQDKQRTGSASGKCDNEIVAEAYQETLGRPPRGEGNWGECFPDYYYDDPKEWSKEKIALNIKKRHGISTKMVITDFEPKEGGSNTRVTLKGKNLGKATLAVVGCTLENAKLNDPKCHRIIIAKISDEKVEVQMMPKMNAVAPIVLFSPEDGYVPTPQNFACYPWPVIKEIATPKPRAGEIVELRGEHLFAITGVSVGGEKTHTPEGNHYVSEGGSLQIKIPENAPDEGTINVATKGGHTWIAYKLAKIIPIIYRVEPAKARPGDVVSVYGVHLMGLKNIMIGGKEAKKLGKAEDRNVLVTVPDAPAGKYEVAATGYEGTGKWENKFEILESPEVAKKKLSEEEATRQKAIQEAMRQRHQEEALRKQREDEEQWAPPPPPTEPEEEEQWTPSPAEEEPEVGRQEPQPEEEVSGHCVNGTWSPTLRVCVEDQAPEEVAPPDCGAGAHWSPTLRSCQSD